jgi:hypothetical protein
MKLEFLKTQGDVVFGAAAIVIAITLRFVIPLLLGR